MTRVSRTDSLLTELRDIKRRLRLLEAARMRQGAAVFAPASFRAASAFFPVSLPPVRPVDWPATASPEWERLAEVRVPASYADSVAIMVSTVAEPHTSGSVRILVENAPLGDEMPVTDHLTTHTLPLAGRGADVDIAVEARRLTGQGVLRVASLLVPSALDEVS